MEQNPCVSIIFVNYNGITHFDLFMKSLFAQSYQDFELIMVDNDSTDDSVNYVRQNFPRVKIIEAKKNLGFGAGNNLGIKHSRGEFIVFTNYDVEFDTDWLANMVASATASEDVGLIAPKIMYFDKRDIVQTCGLTFQYTGHAFSRGLGEPSESYPRKEDIGSVTGCAFLIKKSVINEVGAFDEEFHKFGEFFFSSLEDVDLSWRAQLAGYRILFEPTSIMYHKYEQKPLTPLRYYYLECGRIYMLSTNYALITLILLLPALFVSEVLSFAYLALKGSAYFMMKLRSLKWFINSFQQISIKRREVQEIRNIQDKKILKHFQSDTSIRHIHLPLQLVKIIEYPINVFFRIYQAFILAIIS